MVCHIANKEEGEALLSCASKRSEAREIEKRHSVVPAQRFRSRRAQNIMG